MNPEWIATGLQDVCTLTVATDIEPGYMMEFAGTTSETYINEVWAPGTVRVWIGTKGTWTRQFTFGESHQAAVQTAVNDHDILFPSEAFTPLDEVLNDKQTVVADYDANTVTWTWNAGTQLTTFVSDILNTHVLRYPFTQTTNESADLACLMMNATPEDVGTTWTAQVISTDHDNVVVTNEGVECWYVSVFTDMEKTDDTPIARGQFRKMQSPSVILKQTLVPNRVIKLVKLS